MNRANYCRSGSAEVVELVQADNVLASMPLDFSSCVVQFGVCLKLIGAPLPDSVLEAMDVGAYWPHFVVLATDLRSFPGVGCCCPQYQVHPQLLCWLHW